MTASRKLGLPVDLDNVIEKARNRVYRVGIELEGGWRTLPPGTNLTRDGSIRFNADIKLQGMTHIGELSSRPLAVEEIEPWLRTFHPHFVNETCGMHVHMSFRSAFAYMRLMDRRYPATIIAYVTTWAKEQGLPTEHPIWPRLAGKSEFCQHTFWADEQVQRTQKDYDRHREGNRYSVVNYCHSIHSTLECRLLPMMANPDMALSAIRKTIQVTNAFLATSKGREEKLEGVHTVDEERMVEEKQEFV